MSIWTQVYLTEISFPTISLWVFYLFVTAIILVLVRTLAIYLLCKHKKLKPLVTSLALQQIKEVGTVTTKQEDVSTACTCKIQSYTIVVFKYFNLLTSDFCNSTLSKTKTVQNTFVLQCS